MGNACVYTQYCYTQRVARIYNLYTDKGSKGRVIPRKNVPYKV